MCLILLAYQQHADYPLIVAANRDEFYSRPTAPLQPWRDAPHILAGRDLQAGGTWLGVSTDGRLAAITNFRGSGQRNPDAPSRGELPTSFLSGTVTASEFLAQLTTRADDYQGFNLLLHDATGLWYFSNRGVSRPQRLTPGFYGLSNHLLDTPWPKITRGKQTLTQLLASGRPPTTAALLQLLADRWQPPLDTLPDTGIGSQREQLLAPIFIAGIDYGTRCSTATLLHGHGRWEVAERTHADGELRHYYWPCQREEATREPTSRVSY